MHELKLVTDEMQDRSEFVCGEHECSGELITIETEYAREVHMRCSPTQCPGWREDFATQAEAFYHCLPKLLARNGGSAAHVISERVFFENFARDFDTFERIRANAYELAQVPQDQWPATTYIQQPPCCSVQKLEMQLHAIIPKSPHDVIVNTTVDPETNTTAKLIEIAGVQHLFIPNIQGVTKDGTLPRGFREQCDQMFDNCRHLLAQHDTRFSDVLRTWCYLAEMDRDYAEFNLSRNAFFAKEDVWRLPASTGIEAELWPMSALCSVDLYAIINPDAVDVSVMCTPTLNEAPEYGSAFSRGMRIDLPDKTVLYISGTASIDEQGQTVHVDDIELQIDRMLLNIEQLLNAQGATFANLVQASSYLKHSRDLLLYERKLSEWGIRNLPNTLVEAGVCRPDLLCEMEAIAVLPHDPH
jgi:enamine deaminase RidA (YjgF/YER057c/UK114 family)